MVDWLGQLGFALPMGMGAVGSSLGVLAAGTAAAGAWAKEAKEGKTLNFLYIALTGMPLTQTIYGFILGLAFLKSRVYDPTFLAANAPVLFSIGLACGLGELFSAWVQGLIGAAAVRAMSEGEGKPFVFCVIAMGIAETIGLFSCFLCFLMAPA